MNEAVSDLCEGKPYFKESALRDSSGIFAFFSDAKVNIADYFVA